jgi:hypothetical protein
LPKRNGTTACVLGNFNKGKSWLLSKLSRQNIQQGFDVSTVGLSLIHDESMAICYLDTAGFELPTPINKYY